MDTNDSMTWNWRSKFAILLETSQSSRPLCALRFAGAILYVKFLQSYDRGSSRREGLQSSQNTTELYSFGEIAKDFFRSLFNVMKDKKQKERTRRAEERKEEGQEEEERQKEEKKKEEG